MKRTACRSVDSYWNFGGDVSFIQVFSEGFIGREIGAYGRIASGVGYLHHFQVVQNCPFLTTSDVENAMIQVIELGFDGRHFHGCHLTESLQPIDAKD
jgi:hypothetical protein